MSWDIRWTDEAVRDLSNLDQQVARRIVKKLEETLDDPGRYFRRLKGHDEQRLRVGDHRVIASLAFAHEHVIVLRVGHRSKIYRDD